MKNITKFLVIGVGVDESNHAGEKGVMCQTWPDCEVKGPGAPDNDERTPFDDLGYVSVKGKEVYSAVGGRVFSDEYAAIGWLEYTDAGRRFKRAFLNVLVVRAAA